MQQNARMVRRHLVGILCTFLQKHHWPDLFSLLQMLIKIQTSKMCSLDIYKLNSPRAPVHRFSLHPMPPMLAPSQAAWYHKDIPMIQHLCCARHSVGLMVLLNPNTKLMRRIISLLHIVLQEGKMGSQRSKLTQGGFKLGRAKNAAGRPAPELPEVCGLAPEDT